MYNCKAAQAAKHNMKTTTGSSSNLTGGNLRGSLTLLQVKNNTWGVFNQIVYSKKDQTGVQCYLVLFNQVVEINRNEFLHPMMDIVLEEESIFMLSCQIHQRFSTTFES